MVFFLLITSYFDIENNPQSHFFDTHILPMVMIDNKSKVKLAQIVTNRMDKVTFFFKDALPYIIQQSGGCPRQLLRIVHKSLIKSRGDRISKEIAEKACHELAQSMWELLDSDHLSILKNHDYYSADRKVMDLLIHLQVLKYNGTRKVNPLIIGAGLLK